MHTQKRPTSSFESHNLLYTKKRKTTETKYTKPKKYGNICKQ